MSAGNRVKRKKQHTMKSFQTDTCNTCCMFMFERKKKKHHKHKTAYIPIYFVGKVLLASHSGRPAGHMQKIRHYATVNFIKVSFFPIPISRLENKNSFINSIKKYIGKANAKYENPLF